MYRQVNLFNQSELQLLDEIDAAVTKRYHKYDVHAGLDENDPRSGQFMEKVSLMDRNLNTIMKSMTEQNDSKERFLESYLEWKGNREKCIHEFQKIAKSLDRDKHMTNIARLCGLCLSIGGGVGLIASGAVTVCPDSALIVSGAIAATGTSIALGASITKSVRLVRKIKKVKRLIEKDQAYFQDIQEWLNHAQELQDALNSVLDIDILKGICTDIKKIIRKAVKIKNEFKKLRFIEKKVNSIISSFGEDTNVPITAMIMIPRILITTVILLCRTENCLVGDFASVTAKSATVVGLLVANSLQALASTASTIGLSSAQVLKLATGLIGITLDAVAIVRTCVDIHRKSRSPEAKKILTIVMNYNEEVKTLDNLYERLSSGDYLSPSVKLPSERFQLFKADAGNQFQHLETDVDNQVQHLLTDVDNQVQHLLTDVDNQFQHLLTDVDNHFQPLEADVDNQFQHLETDIDNQFQYLETDVSNQFQHLETDLCNQFQHLETNVDNQFQHLETYVSNQFQHLETDL